MSLAVAPSERTKIDLLRRHGYKYNIERGAYVNRQSRKVMSEEFVEDRPGAGVESEDQNLVVAGGGRGGCFLRGGADRESPKK